MLVDCRCAHKVVFVGLWIYTIVCFGGCDVYDVMQHRRDRPYLGLCMTAAVVITGLT